MSSARATWRKFLGAACAATLAGAPAASAIHLLAVPHEVCADHGELIHGDHAPVAAPEAEDSRFSVADTGSHEHDHCLLAAPAAGASLRPSTVAVSTPVALSDRESPARPWIPSATRALYLLAPKTSPPA